MSPFTSGLPGALQDAGLVLGLVISLTIASYLIKDNLLARLGQYVLVGSGLGYMAVLAWRNVLWPRLFAPLIADPMSWLSAPEPTLLKSWLPVILGLLMWAGGVELLRRPPKGTDGRGILRLLAVVPVAVLVGVGLGVGLSGAVQGTLWPQLAAAMQSTQAAVATAGDARPAADQATWLVRFITLLITGGVLIHFQLGRAFSASARHPTPRRAFRFGGYRDRRPKARHSVQNADPETAGSVGRHWAPGSVVGRRYGLCSTCGGPFFAGAGSPGLLPV